MSEIAVDLKDITKAYPGVIACDQVSVEFRHGEIHALLGENGAGKSTLVNVLAGLIPPDTGTITVGDRPVQFTGPKDAMACGVGIVPQVGSLIDTLTIAENLYLAAINRQSQATKAPSFRLNVSPQCLVEDLTPRERRLVELHRLLAQEANVLILDEPTAVLTSQEADLLFQELRMLADAGHALVIVTHKLPEVLAHADRVTVMRKGRVCSRMSRHEITAEQLSTSLIVGKEVSIDPPSKPCPDASAIDRTPLVKLRGVCTISPHSAESPLADLELVVRRGEVLGIAGRPGSGIGSLLKVLSGVQNRITRGSVEWDLKPAGTPRIGWIPNQGAQAGCIATFTVAVNLALRRRDLLGWRLRRSQRARLAAFAEALIRRFHIQPPDAQRPIGTLSGGNAQKVLAARELDYATDLLLVENPTSGLDHTSAATVRQAIRTKALGGTAVVVHADDIDEVVGIADRIVVLSRGRITVELTGREMTRDAVGLALLELTPDQALSKELNA